MNASAGRLLRELRSALSRLLARLTKPFSMTLKDALPRPRPNAPRRPEFKSARKTSLEESQKKSVRKSSTKWISTRQDCKGEGLEKPRPESRVRERPEPRENSPQRERPEPNKRHRKWKEVLANRQFKDHLQRSKHAVPSKDRDPWNSPQREVVSKEVHSRFARKSQRQGNTLGRRKG